MGESRLALGALLIVPVAVLVFVFCSSEDSAPERTRTAQERSKTREDDTPREFGHPADDRALRSSPSHPKPGDVSPARGLEIAGEGQERDDGSSAEDDEDFVGKIQRFDDNSAKFDERLAVFDRESVAGSFDDALSDRVLDSLGEQVRRLAPEAEVRVTCTVSVCEVEIASDAAVGILLSDLAPWRRTMGDGATGNPRATEDNGHAFRLLFSAENFSRDTHE